MKTKTVDELEVYDKVLFDGVSNVCVFKREPKLSRALELFWFPVIFYNPKRDIIWETQYTKYYQFRMISDALQRDSL